MIALQGDILFTATEELRRELDAALGASRPVLVDLSGVRYCSAAALGLLAWAAGRCAARGQVMKIVAAPPRLQRLIAAAGLCGVLDMCESEADALATLSPRLLAAEVDGLIEG